MLSIETTYSLLPTKFTSLLYHSFSLFISLLVNDHIVTLNLLFTSFSTISSFPCHIHDITIPHHFTSSLPNNCFHFLLHLIVSLTSLTLPSFPFPFPFAFSFLFPFLLPFPFTFPFPSYPWGNSTAFHLGFRRTIRNDLIDKYNIRCGTSGTLSE